MVMIADGGVCPGATLRKEMGGQFKQQVINIGKEIRKQKNGITQGDIPNQLTALKMNNGAQFNTLLSYASMLAMGFVFFGFIILFSFIPETLGILSSCEALKKRDRNNCERGQGYLKGSICLHLPFGIVAFLAPPPPTLNDRLNPQLMGVALTMFFLVSYVIRSSCGPVFHDPKLLNSVVANLVPKLNLDVEELLLGCEAGKRMGQLLPPASDIDALAEVDKGVAKEMANIPAVFSTHSPSPPIPRSYATSLQRRIWVED